MLYIIDNGKLGNPCVLRYTVTQTLGCKKNILRSRQLIGHQSEKKKWQGHVIRQPEERPSSSRHTTKAQGQGMRIAPRKTWMTTVKVNLREAGLTFEDEMTLVKDRLEWRRIVHKRPNS